MNANPELKCAYCQSYSDLEMSSIKCPNCLEATLTFPLDENIDELKTMTQADHDLLQVACKSLIKLNEDLKKLEAKIFPPGTAKRKDLN